MADIEHIIYVSFVLDGCSEIFQYLTLPLEASTILIDIQNIHLFFFPASFKNTDSFRDSSTPASDFDRSERLLHFVSTSHDGGLCTTNLTVNGRSIVLSIDGQFWWFTASTKNKRTGIPPLSRPQNQNLHDEPVNQL